MALDLAPILFALRLEYTSLMIELEHKTFCSIPLPSKGYKILPVSCKNLAVCRFSPGLITKSQNLIKTWTNYIRRHSPVPLIYRSANSVKVLSSLFQNGSLNFMSVLWSFYVLTLLISVWTVEFSQFCRIFPFLDDNRFLLMLRVLLYASSLFIVLRTYLALIF